MAEDKKTDKDFSKRTNQLIALTALILAICATFSSLYAGANASKGILAQNKASDGWSYYQAKSIKQTIYESELAMLEIDPPANPDPAKLEALKKNYKDNIDRYEIEQNEIKTEAQTQEKKPRPFPHAQQKFRGRADVFANRNSADVAGGADEATLFLVRGHGNRRVRNF